MKYKVDYRFWGTVELNTVYCYNANQRDKLVHELETDYAITYISISKVLKGDVINPLKSMIIH